MGFSMFSAQPSPIAIDFGSASVKLLQIGPGERTTLLAAAGLPIPDSLRAEKDEKFKFFEKQLPQLLTKGKFKGKRTICSVPSGQTFIQHMQIAGADGGNRDDLIKAQLQAQLGLPADGMVLRTVAVADVHGEGQGRSELICIAVGRDTVMRYVQLLKKCKLETVGVQSGVIAMVRAFDYLHCRQEDTDLTTLYVDLGWGSTKVAIAHGKQIVFARCIHMGGQQVDRRIAEKLQCDVASARKHRLSGQVPSAASLSRSQQDADSIAPTESLAVATAMTDPATEAQTDQVSSPVGVAQERRVAATPPELTSLVAQDDSEAGLHLEISSSADAVADELSMCLRYHQSLFRNRPVDQMIFLGGEARDVRLCQHVARALRLPAQLGDPMARLVCAKSQRTPGLDLGKPQPGWAVACGMCTAPTDL